MEVFGKIGMDVLKVQGTFIYSNHIYQILSKYYKYLQIPDFKLHVYEITKKNKIMIKLVLQLLPKNKKIDLNKLKKDIVRDISSKLVITPQNTLSDLVEKELFLPLEIEFVEIFPFSPKQTSIISHIM